MGRQTMSLIIKIAQIFSLYVLFFFFCAALTTVLFGASFQGAQWLFAVTVPVFLTWGVGRWRREMTLRFAGAKRAPRTGPR